jgi:anti-sigma regulatory factor (Ser/Thr protein kinase)
MTRHADLPKNAVPAWAAERLQEIRLQLDVSGPYRRTVAGPVRLLARRTRRAVHVTVADRGIWRQPGTVELGEVTVRGRGLPLIRRLVPDVHIELAATGTTVHLRAAVPSPT